MSSLPDRFTCTGCGETRNDLLVANDSGYFCTDCEGAGLDLGVTKSSSETRPDNGLSDSPAADRNSAGRFVTGNPGGPGRPRLYRDDAEGKRVRRRRRAEAKAVAASRPGRKRKHRDNAARQRAYRLRKIEAAMRGRAVADG